MSSSDDFAGDERFVPVIVRPAQEPDRPMSQPMNQDYATQKRTVQNGALVTKLMQTTCAICGGAGFVVPDLPLGHPDFGKAVPCICREEEHAVRHMRLLQKMSSLGPLGRLTFETFIPEPSHLSSDRTYNLRRAFDTCAYFAQEPEGWLLLTGTFGCGKTHLAAAIANRAFGYGRAGIVYGGAGPAGSSPRDL